MDAMNTSASLDKLKQQQRSRVLVIHAAFARASSRSRKNMLVTIFFFFLLIITTKNFGAARTVLALCVTHERDFMYIKQTNNIMTSVKAKYDDYAF